MHVEYDVDNTAVLVHMKNTGVNDAVVTMEDHAYNIISSKDYSVTAETESTLSFDISASGNWYDFSASVMGDGDVKCYDRRFAGRMETGKDTISDPAMSAAIPDITLSSQHAKKHPPMAVSIVINTV